MASARAMEPERGMAGARAMLDILEKAVIPATTSITRLLGMIQNYCALLATQLVMIMGALDLDRRDVGPAKQVGFNFGNFSLILIITLCLSLSLSRNFYLFIYLLSHLLPTNFQIKAGKWTLNEAASTSMSV